MAFSTFIFVLLLAAPSAFAQELYSFSESIDILSRHNAELKAAEASLDSARNQLNGTYSNFLPELSVGSNYLQKQVNDENSQGYGAEVVLSQNFFNGFRDVNALDDVKARVDLAEASLRNVKSKLSQDLKSAFANLIFAHESIKLADSIHKRRSDNLSLVQLRFESGRENKGSVMLSAAYLKQASIELRRAQLNLENAKTDYLRVLGLPLGKDVDIQGGMPDAVEPATTPQFLDLVNAVPDRVMQVARLKSAEINLKNSYSDFMPTLVGKAKMGQNGATYFPHDNDYWELEAVFNWTLFSGGRSYFASKSSLAEKLVAENNLRNMDLSLAASLRVAYSEFILAIESAKLSEDFVEAQNVRAEIGRGKYNNGLSTFDDWDIIENDLINRQKDLVQKRRDKAVAEASWERAQGRGVVP